MRDSYQFREGQYSLVFLVHSKERCLHILFNSGGVFMVPIDQLTSGLSANFLRPKPFNHQLHTDRLVDGYDLQFGE